MPKEMPFELSLQAWYEGPHINSVNGRKMYTYEDILEANNFHQSSHSSSAYPHFKKITLIFELKDKPTRSPQFMVKEISLKGHLTGSNILRHDYGFQKKKIKEGDIFKVGKSLKYQNTYLCNITLDPHRYTPLFPADDPYELTITVNEKGNPTASAQTAEITFYDDNNFRKYLQKRKR